MRFKSEKLVYWIFLLVGFAFVAYFKGFNTAYFLLLFLLMLVLTAYSIVGIFNFSRGINEKTLIPKVVCSLIVGTALYYKYGSYLLLKAISVSIVIVVVIGLYVLVFNKSR